MFRGRADQVTGFNDLYLFRSNSHIRLWEVTNGVSQTVEAGSSI